MDTYTIVIIVALVVLILCSAFFSGSETALMASSRPKLHNMEKDGHKGAKRVNKLIENPELLLSTILLGNNLVNIGASALATGIFIKLFGEAGIVYATLVMTLIVLIFAEVLPKTVASHWSEKMALIVSWPMHVLVALMRPATWLVRKMSRMVMYLVGLKVESNDPNFGEDDVRGAIGMGLESGFLEKGKHRMLDTVLDLDEITVEDVMVHRSAMESLNINSDIDDLYQQVAACPFSRLPVWKNDPDNIIGTIHVKDFYTTYHKAKKDFNLHNILQAPYFVPETAKISQQMLEFRKNRRHMGIVVDEYGDIQGVITLEDILEEIVGEIEDEHDEPNIEFNRHEDGSIVMGGSFPVRDANREFGWDLPDDESVTVGGLVTATAERIPTVGEEIEIAGVTFRVLAKRHQAITRLRACPASES